MGFSPASKTPERGPVAPTPEVLSVSERASDRSSEQTREATVTRETSSEPPSSVSLAAATPSAIGQKDERLLAIESTLSEGLEELFMNLPSEMKPAFKAKGEEVAQTIKVWMDDAKLVARKVLKLIRAWLGMVPHVNKYFLEQESKIKRDHIMALAESNQNDVLL
ncbi:MAG: hypothetical protein AAB570_03090 [Patescibacteria group bacterium]